ncbi:hypothetical protein G9A89_016542 [Geosiphon pyriformis]|nr:hypothetical protein G9A89_016542 [Geosiphon pyriformis]
MTINGYKLLNTCGDGASGTVFKAREEKTGQFFAIKRVARCSRYNTDGREFQIQKEINVLQKMHHENVIALLHWDKPPSPRSAAYLVFPYCPFTLNSLLCNYKLNEIQKKLCIWMILQGLAYIHEQGVIHRDLSARNILINEDGVIKIADFGNAWMESETCEDETRGNLNFNVGTRYYRAPELFFSCSNYTKSIDLWSVGCIIAEFFTEPVGTHLFCGESDLEQICKIFRVLGAPNDSTWPQMKEFPDYGKLEFISHPTNGLDKQHLPNVNEFDTIQFIKKFLVYPSEKRMSARKALEDSYLSTISSVGIHLDISSLEEIVQEHILKDMDGKELLEPNIAVLFDRVEEPLSTIIDHNSHETLVEPILPALENDYCLNCQTQTILANRILFIDGAYLCLLCAEHLELKNARSPQQREPNENVFPSKEGLSSQASSPQSEFMDVAEHESEENQLNERLEKWRNENLSKPRQRKRQEMLFYKKGCSNCKFWKLHNAHRSLYKIVQSEFESETDEEWDRNKSRKIIEHPSRCSNCKAATSVPFFGEICSACDHIKRSNDGSPCPKELIEENSAKNQVFEPKLFTRRRKQLWHREYCENCGKAEGRRWTNDSQGRLICGTCDEYFYKYKKVRSEKQLKSYAKRKAKHDAKRVKKREERVKRLRNIIKLSTPYDIVPYYPCVNCRIEVSYFFKNGLCAPCFSWQLRFKEDRPKERKEREAKLEKYAKEKVELNKFEWNKFTDHLIHDGCKRYRVAQDNAQYEILAQDLVYNPYLLPRDTIKSRWKHFGRYERPFMLVFEDHVPFRDAKGNFYINRSSNRIPIDAAAKFAINPEIFQHRGISTFKLYMRRYDPYINYDDYGAAVGRKYYNEHSPNNLSYNITAEEEADLTFTNPWEFFDAKGNLMNSFTRSDVESDINDMADKEDSQYLDNFSEIKDTLPRPQVKFCVDFIEKPRDISAEEESIFYTKNENKIVYVFKIQFLISTNSENETHELFQNSRGKIQWQKSERLMERGTEYEPKYPPAVLTLSNTKYYYRDSIPLKANKMGL